MNDNHPDPRDIYKDAIIKAGMRLDESVAAANSEYGDFVAALQRDYEAQETSAWQRNQIAHQAARNEFNQAQAVAWQRYCDTAGGIPLEMTP